MPIVQMYPASAAATASATARAEEGLARMTWSAANEPMMTSGSRRSRIAAASPIAAAESRGSDSRKTLSSARPGSSFSTAARCARPVTTAMRCSPERGSRRSQVSRSRVCPEPVRSWRNFGASARESGHSRDADAAGGDHAVEVLDWAGRLTWVRGYSAALRRARPFGWPRVGRGAEASVISTSRD